MKKSELVYSYILEQRLENKRKSMTQAEIAAKLNLSLSIVNAAILRLKKMNAVRVNLRSFDIGDAKKILYYWSSVRDVGKDIIYSTRVDDSASGIEKSVPPGFIYAAYTAYKMKFNDVPADYSEVYVYGDMEAAKKRFSPSKNRPNLFVMKPGPDRITIANIFADLWNMKEWYAKDFLSALEVRINGILE